MSGEPWLMLRTMRLSAEEGSAVGVKKRRTTDDEPSRMQAWLANVELLGFESYYPMISELKRKPRRELSHEQRTSGMNIMRHRVLPFLPQIVFVRGLYPMQLLRVPGAIGFLAIGSELARITDVGIKSLRAREVDGVIAGKTPAEFIFERGDGVEVVNGPFSNSKGIVEIPPSCALQDIDAATRLKLTIDIFGRKTVVDVAVADVRKL